MRKPVFCLCKIRGADKKRGNHAADQRLCFCCIDSTVLLPPKFEFQASSHLLWLYSPVCVGLGWKHRRQFLMMRLICLLFIFRLHGEDRQCTVCLPHRYPGYLCWGGSILWYPLQSTIYHPQVSYGGLVSV